MQMFSASTNQILADFHLSNYRFWMQKEVFDVGLQQSGGLRSIVFVPFGLRNFTNSVKSIKVVNDVKGLTFRTLENAMSIQMVEYLGAHPVPLAGSEMYMAMQQGVVDGHENALTSIIQDLTFEVQNHLCLDAHFLGADCAMLSDKWYSSLPSDLQDLVVTAIKDASKEADKSVDNILSNGLTFLKDYMEIYQPTDAELEKWQSTVRAGCEDWMRNEVGSDLVDSMLAEIEKPRG